MKHYKSFILCASALLGLSSCVSEDFDWKFNQGKQGTMSLNLELVNPSAHAQRSATAAEACQDFPITITSVETGEVLSYANASAVPEVVTLYVGKYEVAAHTQGELEKYSDNPYYKGVTVVDVVADADNKADVVCKMANGSITVTLDPAFVEEFTSWTITIDDGGEGVLEFNESAGLNPPTKYVEFVNECTQLTLNFRGVTSNGSTVSSSSKLNKSQSGTHYDDDNDYFCGGDLVSINLAPTADTDGDVTSITINANVVFAETSEDVELTVDEIETLPEGPNPPSEGNCITLGLPAPITLASDDALAGNYDASIGDVNIVATDGIKSLLVKVVSSNDEMIEQLTDVAAQYDGVDLVNGCEVVGNNNLVEFLAGLGQEISVPTVGDASYTFPIGNFFLFLGLLPGEHNFTLQVTCNNGETLSGTVKVTITE